MRISKKTAVPRIRFPIELTIEENDLAETIAKDIGTKSAVFKKGLNVLRDIKDAIKEGKQVVIVGSNGQQTNVAYL